MEWAEGDGEAQPLSAHAEARAAAVVTQLERRRPDAFSHARRVAELSVRVARYAHLPASFVSHVYWGALVHDIGELNVQPTLLRKDETVDESERMTICRHTTVGARWLKGVPELAPLVPFARWHHERFDGLGYPDGVGAQQIPLGVALVGVCDAWDALTGPRPHRDALAAEAAAEEMARHAGRQWSRVLVTWVVECATELPAPDTDPDR